MEQTGRGGRGRSDRNSVHPVRSTPRLRRRITLAFVGAIVTTALALSAGAYVIIGAGQDRAAVDSALSQSRFNLELAELILPDAYSDEDFQRLLASLAIRGDFATLVMAPQGTFVSGPQISAGLISPELAERVSSGRLAYQRVEMGGEPTIAVGSRLRSDGLTLYFFYPQTEAVAALERLRNVLVIIGTLLVALGGSLGYFLARRTLKPVRAAQAAAARMSQGDLGARLSTGPDEFGALGVSFNRMAEALQSKMDALEEARARERRFVADVAHELRTPVAALLAEVSLLENRLSGEPVASESEDTDQLARLMVDDVRRLRRLVDDLLEINRLDAGAAEVTLEEVVLTRFLQEMIRARGWEQSVSLVSAVGPGDASAADVRLITDKRRLELIIGNVVENARRHGKPPIEVAVFLLHSAEKQLPCPAATEPVQRSQALVAVSIVDHGPGILEEHLEHVFERFFKADPSRASGGGSGLGLAIARENARLLQGELVASNSPGAGACFLLTLPLVCES